MHAPGEGDDTIAAIAETHRDVVVVVTADRELAERVRAAIGKVVGPRGVGNADGRRLRPSRLG